MNSNKKAFSILVAILLATSMATTAFAVNTLSQPRFGFYLVDSETAQSISKGPSASPSWGQGNLYASKPALSNAQAYAVTTYNDGEAYRVSAKVSVKNKDGTTDSLEETIEKNAPSATTGTITSKSSTGTFSGAHRIQKSSSSGWQSCSTSWTP